MTAAKHRVPLDEQDKQGRWASVARSVEPSEELVGKTVDAMRHAAARRPAQHMAPVAKTASQAWRAPAFSRRGFVALGGVCAVAAVAVAVGVPLVRRDAAPEDAVPGTAPVFGGLAIAQAAEPGKTVVIEPADGEPLSLTGSDNFHCLELRLNLACTGKNIETLVFSLLDVPTQSRPCTRPFDPEEIVSNLVVFSKDLMGPYDVAALDAWYADSDEAFTSGPELAVNLREHPGWNGTCRAEYGTVCDVVYASSPDGEFWNQDPVMQAKNAWLSATARTYEEVSREERYALEGSYVEAYAQVSATQEDAVEWARERYVCSMVLAARELTKVTLRVRAGFADGSDVEKRYRIGTVENFEEAMGARYDALYELRSSEPDLSYSCAPFYSFVEEYHDPSEDSRLAVPLFTITDATDAAQS